MSKENLVIVVGILVCVILGFIFEKGGWGDA